jgi:hypothetical protein
VSSRGTIAFIVSGAPLLNGRARVYDSKMASKKHKRPSSRPRRTAIVPRVVFQTAVALAVVPAASAIAGCTSTHGPILSVAVPQDAGRDTGFFSVVAIRDAGNDMGVFAVAVPIDSGFSVVAMPPDASDDAGQDTGFFSVVAVRPDA